MSRSLYARLHRRFGPRASVKQRKDRLERHRETWRDRLPPPGFFTRTPAPREGRPRAVVVGGGFGGMMAAACLCEDYEVTVLEARERLGGRVFTQAGDQNRLIEAGAELIGYNHMLWLTLAEDFELGLSLLTDDDASAFMGLELPMVLDGRVIPPNELETIYDEMTDAFDRMADVALSMSNPFTPWTAPDARDHDLKPLSRWIAEQPVLPLTKAALEAQFANNNGAPSAAQSYLANLALVAGGAMNDDKIAFFTESETVRCEEGNQSLAYALAGRVRDWGGRVLTSTAVTGVYVQGGSVLAVTDSGDWSGDILVLATPPTLWPTVDGAPIPAAYRPSMGIVVKYLSNVKNRFWLPQKYSPSSVDNVYGMTWEGTDNQIGRALEFSLFAGGPAAEHALALWEQDPALLHQFYDQSIGKLYDGYVGAVEGTPEFMHWPTDPWTRTGYSCPSPGQETTVAPLLSGSYAERIWFAGEHACPAFFGYMEGALWSGFLAAQHVMGKG